MEWTLNSWVLYASGVTDVYNTCPRTTLSVNESDIEQWACQGNDSMYLNFLPVLLVGSVQVCRNTVGIIYETTGLARWNEACASHF